MQNLLDPAILFFAFGLLAGALRSNLEIPPAISKFLSLYLLMALGLKGGFALAQSGLTPGIAVSLVAAMAMALVVPVLGYAFLKRRVPAFDAAAVAASYGSVSAVSFVTAMQYLDSAGLGFGGHMAVAMVLMESPAILVAMVLANHLRQAQAAQSTLAVGGGGVAVLGAGGPARGPGVGQILHESFTNGPHLLMLGALAVGFISGEAGQAVMKPFAGDLFKGMLAFFLLEMGLMVARHFPSARKASPLLLAYGLLGPWVHATLALALAWVLGMQVADAALLMVLSASASYIVVPAVLRHAIPEANPALYMGLSLGVTFPMNILVGIPAYTAMAQWALG